MSLFAWFIFREAGFYKYIVEHVHCFISTSDIKLTTVASELWNLFLVVSVVSSNASSIGNKCTDVFALRKLQERRKAKYCHFYGWRHGWLERNAWKDRNSDAEKNKKFNYVMETKINKLIYSRVGITWCKL